MHFWLCKRRRIAKSRFVLGAGVEAYTTRLSFRIPMAVKKYKGPVKFEYDLSGIDVGRQRYE